MKKSYNELIWRRMTGLRGLLVFSTALCLTGLLALSSCGDNDEPETVDPIEMRGFYISVNADGNSDCVSEYVSISPQGDDVVGGEPNVTITARSSAFGEGFFPQIGIRVGESDNNPETIVSAYVSETGENFDRPGAYFLMARTDDSIPVAEGETIYTGYWTGYAYRPGGEGTLKPTVVCPYVLVPRDNDILGNIGESQCGMQEGEVHSALAKYLQKDGDLRHCYRLVDDGVLNPMPNQ